MAKFGRGFDLAGYGEKLEKAVDQSVSEYLQLTQGQLFAANPVDTGRMASSWYLTKDTPDLTARSKDWTGLQLKKYPGKITADGNWYIANGVPYSERVAFDPVYGKGGRVGGSAWYTNIVTQQKTTLDKRLIVNLRKIT